MIRHLAQWWLRLCERITAPRPEKTRRSAPPDPSYALYVDNDDEIDFEGWL